jgi:hypothetical protein
MPTMEGTVQEDDYRTEVQFKDKNLLKNQSFCLLRFTESTDPKDGKKKANFTMKERKRKPYTKEHI